MSHTLVAFQEAGCTVLRCRRHVTASVVRLCHVRHGREGVGEVAKEGGLQKAAVASEAREAAPHLNPSTAELCEGLLERRHPAARLLVLGVARVGGDQGGRLRRIDEEHVAVPLRLRLLGRTCALTPLHRR